MAEEEHIIQVVVDKFKFKYSFTSLSWLLYRDYLRYICCIRKPRRNYLETERRNYSKDEQWISVG